METTYVKWLVLLRICRGLTTKVQEQDSELVLALDSSRQTDTEIEIAPKRIEHFSRCSVCYRTMLEATLPDLVLLAKPPTPPLRPGTGRRREELAPPCRELGRIIVAGQMMDASEALDRPLFQLSDSEYRDLRLIAEDAITTYAKATVRLAPPLMGHRDDFRNLFQEGLLAWVDIRRANLHGEVSAQISQSLDEWAAETLTVSDESTKPNSMFAKMEEIKILASDRHTLILDKVLAIPGIKQALSCYKH